MHPHKAIKKFFEPFSTRYLCRKSDFYLCYRLLQGLAFSAETTFPGGAGDKESKRSGRRGTRRLSIAIEVLVVGP